MPADKTRTSGRRIRDHKRNSREVRVRKTFTAIAAVVLGMGALLGSAEAQTAKKFTIALVPGVTTDAFYITMRKGAEAAAKAVGADLVFQGAPEFNAVQQAPVLDAVIARHPPLGARDAEDSSGQFRRDIQRAARGMRIGANQMRAGDQVFGHVTLDPR